MKSNKLGNNALSNTIADHIAEQIVSGKLKPGDKLIEINYAQEYGTSRAPVREAIYLLDIEGLVERIPRKGAIVKEYTANEIYDLLEIRIMLENMALDRIRRNGIDKSLIKEMAELHENMKIADQIQSYTQLNHSFHMCLIMMSKSETIKNMYSKLGWPLLRIQSLSFGNEGNIAKSITEHEIILKHLNEQNFEELSKILKKHNEDVILSIQKKLCL